MNMIVLAFGLFLPMNETDRIYQDYLIEQYYHQRVSDYGCPFQPGDYYNLDCA